MFIAIRDVPVSLYEKGYKYFGSHTKMYFQHPETRTRVTLIAAGLPLGSVLVEKYDAGTQDRVSHEIIEKIRSRKALNEFLHVLEKPL